MAADLVVAVEPIDYAGVCDAYGSGYMYLPGTETCLSIGGYLQFDLWVYDNDQVQNYFNIAKYLSGASTDPSNPLSDVTGDVAGYLYETDDYAAPWTFSEEIKIAFDAKTAERHRRDRDLCPLRSSNRTTTPPTATRRLRSRGP